MTGTVTQSPGRSGAPARRTVPLVLAALLVGPGYALAQAQCFEGGESRGGTTNTVQPSIIVIPFTRENEDLRTVLESDPLRRVAVTTVAEGFDNLDFQTVNLRAVMDAVSRGSALTIDAESDFKTRIIEQSRADIYVEVEVLEPEASGGLVSYSVIRTAYLTTNGRSLANDIGYSGRYRGVEESRLVERAAGGDLDALLATMQRGFDDIRENGAVISVDISVAEGAAVDLSTDVGPDAEMLSFALEDWFAENAWLGDYNISGSTDVRMILDHVRIPLRDPSTCRNYNPSRFAREIIRFLDSVDVDAQPTINRGLVLVTLQ